MYEVLNYYVRIDPDDTELDHQRSEISGMKDISYKYLSRTPFLFADSFYLTLL